MPPSQEEEEEEEKEEEEEEEEKEEEEEEEEDDLLVSLSLAVSGKKDSFLGNCLEAEKGEDKEVWIQCSLVTKIVSGERGKEAQHFSF